MLGTIDRTPPPFFRQGYSALTKVVFFSALALFLMVADTRLAVTMPLRAAMAAAINPLQRALQVPVELVQGGGDYLRGLRNALAGEDAARKRATMLAERAAAADRLADENTRLRALLDMKTALPVRAQAAQVLYEASDPFSRKVFIDRGMTQGIVAGSPVLTDSGVIGQVTRAYPLSSEVTLVTDKDAAIPVLNRRTQQRGAAFGGIAQGSAMELRFVAANADVKVGDELRTSGIDGVYPPDLPVAKVASVERLAEGGFARVILAPAAPFDGVRHVLVLEPLSAQMPARPAPEPVAVEKPAKGKKS